jgi:hypothetical protein
VVEVESSLEVTTRETAQNALVWVDILVSQDPRAVSRLPGAAILPLAQPRRHQSQHLI